MPPPCARAERTYNLDAAVAGQITPLVVGAFAAHYGGDEAAPSNVLATVNGMAASSDPSTKALGQSLLGLWTDLPPADNTLEIVLTAP